MFKFLITLLVAFGLISSANAATGCILTSNKTKIYTSLISGTNYRSTTSSTSPAGCTYKQTGGSCTVANAGPALLGTTTNLECPIDDYVWLIMLTLGGLGFVYIRKKNLILN
ncbi:MAG: hypothetical protein WC622_11340 [Pedobacter sp.]|jgi:hypothetical protein|uniref:hypothetical protein n=1 Tax=Pedobacter sp. TaxID=1411316 RepID=UPI00356392C0